MQKILRRRVFRELKANFFRYTALFLLIVMGMYIIVSIVGAAENVIIGVDSNADSNNVEDGEFSVFVPLKVSEVNELNNNGVTIEKEFYMDYKVEDGSIIRVFKNRKEINLVQLDIGKDAENDNEIVLEKKYAQAHEYDVGDEITIAGVNLNISGIGSSPDYDAVYMNMSDTTANNDLFGIMFVNDATYDELAATNEEIKTEEYVYSYKTDNSMTSQDLKEKLEKFPLDIKDVKDKYFVSMIDEAEQDKDDMQKGIDSLVEGASNLKDGAGEVSDGASELNRGVNELSNGASNLNNGASRLAAGNEELSDGAEKLSQGTTSMSNGTKTMSDGSSNLADGMGSLSGNSEQLRQGADSIFSSLLETAGSQLRSAGINVNLQTDTYSDILMETYTQLKDYSTAQAQAVLEIKNQLDGVAKFKKGIYTYTEGVDSAADASNELKTGAESLNSGTSEVSAGADGLANGSSELSKGAAKLAQGSDSLYEGTKTLSEGSKNLADGAVKLHDGTNELYNGVLKLQEETDNLIDTYFKIDLDNLTQFVVSSDNPRIMASVNDVIISKQAGMIAGIIVMILFTYVISVFVVQSIEQESSVIGALYALGVTKRQLLKHYLTLPVFITCLAGVAGTLIGFSPIGIQVQMANTYAYYSVPELTDVYPVYLLIYGLAMPGIVAAVVNYFVINKKLSKPVLAMLKKEQKIKGVKKVNLGKMGFIKKFQIRQFIRESRTSLAVVFGMFISLLILMIGIDCYVICNRMSVQTRQDTKFEYMYSYKYPSKEVPEGGEACYLESLKREAYGYNLDVNVMGIDKDNKYFNVDVSKGKNKVTISSSVANKFNLSKGDKFILSDEINGIDYGFTVDDVVQYSTGLYIFMDIDSMRELFGQKDDYYNVVLSDGKLNIDNGRLYAVTTKEDLSESSDVFKKFLVPLVLTMIGGAMAIFIIVMYLMIKVMIDRSSFNISLIKIFGYNDKEVRKLYLDGNFIMILVSAAICIPLSKLIMDMLYPYMVANVACGIDLTFGWELYALIYAGVIGCYLVINKFLVRRLKKMVPAEVLKNRE